MMQFSKTPASDAPQDSVRYISPKRFFTLQAEPAGEPSYVLALYRTTVSSEAGWQQAFLEPQHGGVWRAVIEIPADRRLWVVYLADGVPLLDRRGHREKMAIELEMPEGPPCQVSEVSVLPVGSG